MLDSGKLGHFAPGEGVAKGAQSTAFDDGNWLFTSIPGGVHTALIAAGQIADPFYGENETACAWIEEREWWYRLGLGIPEKPLTAGERLLLTFHGLDTYATIWLDGEEIGRHQNMFRPAVFDITSRATAGATHLLAIKFDPPLIRIAGKTLSAWGRNPERSPMRKAQFGYGWDWGPRLPTVGIWRPVELKRQRTAAFTGVHFSTVDLTPAHDRAVVSIKVEAERFAGSAPMIARVTLTPPATHAGAPIVHNLRLDGSGTDLEASTYLVAEKPSLWWTHDLGEPALYQLDVSLLDGDTAIDRIEQEVGIRTLTLDQSPDTEERGTRFFRFVLNGVPIFARGANWIPCDSFIDSIPVARYETLIESARDANMTMLRIWGGGIYEHEPFYDTCDRLGLLVWQDFMFACAMYPEDDPEFAAEVDAEARYQIRRLRNHPSLALWCGNNENQWLHEMFYWDNPTPPAYGELHYNKILPAAVQELDSTTPYWPGSPFGGSDHSDMNDGNRHNWDVWHGNIPRRFGEKPRKDQSPEGVSFLRYADDSGRFISEFGMHAAPVLETLNRVIPSDQLFHHSPAMDWHNKDNPKDKGDNLMLNVTGLPKTLEEYIDFSMIAQAEGLKLGIEHFRRRKPHCSGTLVWQFNDCWPALSWSVLDYYGTGKASYFYLKRVFNLVLASFNAVGDENVELWLTNETISPVHDTVTIRLATFSGATEWQKEIPVEVPANSSCRVWTTNGVGAGGANRYLAIRSATERFPSNRHFFVPIKDLDRTVKSVAHEVEKAGEQSLVVKLTAPADAYGYFVHIEVPQEATRFSDNYFDLEPGESRSVTLKHSKHKLSPEDIRVASR